MPSSARRKPAVAAVAAAPLQVATSCAIPSAVLTAAASFWTTLLEVYPAGSGETPIFWLLVAAAALLAVAAAAALTAIAAGAGPWQDRLARAPLAVALAGLSAAGAILAGAWALTGDPGLQTPTDLTVGGAALAATALLAAHLKPGREWNLHRLDTVELQMLVGSGMAATLVLGMLARPWESASLTGADALPAWYFTTVILAVGAFTGQFMLQTLQRPGAGVMALMIAFGLRALLIGILQRPIGGFEGAAPAFLLAMAPAGLMDLVYFFNLSRADEPRIAWQALTSAVTATLVASLFFLERIVAYPPVTSATIPEIVVAGALGGVGAGWLGMKAGIWVARTRGASAAASHWPSAVALGMIIGTIVAVIGLAALAGRNVLP